MFEPVERRLAPDGKFYTYWEFLDYYGDAVGANDWADARPHDESVDDAPDPAAAGEVSADDTCDNSDPCGELYPDADAGGNDEGVSQATGPVDLLSDERRVALDGRMYYYQQFIDFFGEDDGPTQWADSPPPSPCAVCAGGPEAGTGDLASYCPQCHANICVACGAHLLPGSINGLEGYAECTACSSATDHSAAENGGHFECRGAAGKAPLPFRCGRKRRASVHRRAHRGRVYGQRVPVVPFQFDGHGLAPLGYAATAAGVRRQRCDRLEHG